MNIHAVYDHVAGMLQTQVSIWSADRRLQETFSRRTDLQDPFLSREDFVRVIFDDLSDFPILSVLNELYAYSVIPLEEGFCLIGPVFLRFPKNVFRQISLPSEEQLPPLNTCSADEVLEYGLLLSRLLRASSMSAYECARRNYQTPLHDNAMLNATQKVYQFREEGQPHNPYAQERRLMSAIEKGDFELLEAAQKEQSGGSMGNSSPDPIRNGKNLANAVLTLASRACIRGGVDSEVGYTLCDSYMRQVESLQTMEEMMRLPALINNAFHTMTGLVRDLKNSSRKREDAEEAPIIHACKKYISRHLHEKLTVQDIAAALSVHPNYLTSLFSREEGISLYQYILGEKLRTARNLIVYSDKTFAEIATTLAFVSQSHMGRLFKEKFGITPREYRDQYGKKEIEF